MPTQQAIFDETFLLMRSKLLDIAATLDRIDVAGEGDGSRTQIEDPRKARIEQAIEILASPGNQADRAKRLQQLFSRPYDSKWRSEFGL